MSGNSIIAFGRNNYIDWLNDKRSTIERPGFYLSIKVCSEVEKRKNVDQSALCASAGITSTSKVPKAIIKKSEVLTEYSPYLWYSSCTTDHLG